ncbi:MAG: hypothetical protein M3N57_02135 [Actinomycetota bacterium]|nr:hypothetical protein [Actinomycetota bacterium]
MAEGGLSEEHKKALAKGRRQAKAVRDYLEALESTRRRPGRPVDRRSLEKKIERVQAQIDEETNAAKRVELIQRRLDSERQLAELEEQPDVEALEEDFKQAAGEYSERKGITYSAWREAGVPASVLREAGVPRTRRTA